MIQTTFGTVGVIQTAAKIRQFRHLPPGWRYGIGMPPSEAVIEDALGILFEIDGRAGIPETDAFAGAEGEIQVTGYYRTTFIEFTIDPDDGIRFVREDDGIETSRREHLSFNDSLAILTDIRAELWLSFDSFTGTTLIRDSDGFKTSLSKIPKTVQAFQSWRLDALLGKV